MKNIFKIVKITWAYLTGRGAASAYRDLPYDTGARVVKIPRFNEACVGCKLCEKICPAGAVRVMADRRNEQWKMKSFSLNENLCDGCGLCVEACPAAALVLSESKRGENG